MENIKVGMAYLFSTLFLGGFLRMTLEEVARPPLELPTSGPAPG